MEQSVGNGVEEERAGLLSRSGADKSITLHGMQTLGRVDTLPDDLA